MVHWTSLVLGFLDLSGVLGGPLESDRLTRLPVIGERRVGCFASALAHCSDGPDRALEKVAV
jgi:hypothetical protein